MKNKLQKTASRLSLVLFVFQAVTGFGDFAGPFCNLRIYAGTFTRAKPANVFILTGTPLAEDKLSQLTDADKILIMIPGISSGDLGEQAIFLGEIRRRTEADLAIFHDWGTNDPTRKMAAATATAAGGRDLAALVKLIQPEGKPQKEIIILAHSAGTIVTNKAAIMLSEENIPAHFSRVLFLGTPHDTEADLQALKKISGSILNIHSDFDKINRNISDNMGVLEELEGKNFRNLEMTTSLGGRRIRHYAFLENTPENWLQYSFYLKNGNWPTDAYEKENGTASVDHLKLYRLAATIRDESSEKTEKRESIIDTARSCLISPEPETVYYGALILGLLGNTEFRPELKKTLERENLPGWLRREIYQALGNIADGNDLRYLQQMRKIDPESGEVLRDILRDWKRKRIRPTR